MLAGGQGGLRQLVVVALVALWGARLTMSWVLRWRGLHDEDFRYVEIRAKSGRAYWPASLVAIHLMPTAWVFLGLLPLFPALTRPGFGVLDMVATAVSVLAICMTEAAVAVCSRRRDANNWAVRQVMAAAVAAT